MKRFDSHDPLVIMRGFLIIGIAGLIVTAGKIIDPHLYPSADARSETFYHILSVAITSGGALFFLTVAAIMFKRQGKDLKSWPPAGALRVIMMAWFVILLVAIMIEPRIIMVDLTLLGISISPDF